MKYLLRFLLLGTVFLCGCTSKSTALPQSSSENHCDVTPSSALTQVLTGQWIAADTQEHYEFSEDLTGTKNEIPFTYECSVSQTGTLYVTLTLSTAISETYEISSDHTGYGIIMNSLETKEHFLLFPKGMTELSLKDPSLSGLLGSWKDASGNTYTFYEDFTFSISNGESGTYGLLQKEVSAFPFLTLVFTGGMLEYELNISEDSKTLYLYDSSLQTTYTWYR